MIKYLTVWFLKELFCRFAVFEDSQRFKSILPIFVVAGEAVDDDWNWKSHDEDSTKSAKASNQLAQERVRIQVVPHSSDRH